MTLCLNNNLLIFHNRKNMLTGDLAISLPDNPDFDPNIVSTIYEIEDGNEIVDYSFRYWHVSEMNLVCSDQNTGNTCANETWEPK